MGTSLSRRIDDAQKSNELLLCEEFVSKKSKTISPEVMNELLRLENTTLKRLQLCHNFLEEFPKELCVFTSLEKLELGSNCIKSIPKEISLMKNLKVLDFKDNHISSTLGSPSPLPTEIEHLSSSLQILELGTNHIEVIPREIYNLTSIVKLDFSDNDLTSLPKEIWTLTSLEYINCSKNLIRTINYPEEERAAQHNHSSHQLKGMTLVDFSFNQLTIIPKNLFINIKSLKVLDVKQNFITQIPAEIGELNLLDICDFSSNRISSIPKEIGKLTQLSILNLSTNRISDIPPEICNCTTLNQLLLDKNRITSMPDHISRLTKLEVLDVSSNEITEFPPIAPQLMSLKQLYIHANDIQTLPYDVVQLTELKELTIDQNPLRSFPRNLLDGSVAEIVEHIKKIYTEEDEIQKDGKKEEVI